MMQCLWKHITIKTQEQVSKLIALLKTVKPEIGAFDTETTGLHIINDKPFLFQFGFLVPCKSKEQKRGYTFAVDIERQPNLAKEVIRIWHEYAKHLKVYLGHNVKFDLHMLYNLGLPYTTENVSDTQFYIRYAHDALHQEEGGPPLGLKEYATRYIDYNAKSHEKLLSAEKTEKVKIYHNALKKRLASCKIPKEYQNKYKSFTIALINDLFKDPILDISDLPDDIQQAYTDWKINDLPLYLQYRVERLVEPDMIAYNTLDRENLIRYAHFDIVFTLEIYLQTKDVIIKRGQTKGLECENALIMPLFEMERVGFKIDKRYLENCRIEMKAYIQEQRKKLFELAGKQFSIGQHEVIKQILNTDMGLKISATNATELDLVLNNLEIENKNQKAIKFIKILQELRTLEKWYSAYITRFLKDLRINDRLYTTINQVGTVSGRVSSNFQQFPRDAIKREDGTELFNPRKMVTISGGDYDGIVYCDYSQIELRFQALYTILVGHPDLNLCRAYMPFRCHNEKFGAFDYKNPEHIKHWNDDWYLDESPEQKWVPTDVHGATTTQATGLKPGDEGFKEARYAIGKRTNFAKNYGASYKKIRQMYPHKTEEECHKIDEAYYKAFPGVKAYHSYCYDQSMYSNTPNIFGIKYYNVSGHKLINLLIQGSAAYYLKYKIRELYDYSKAHNIKSRWQMQIHDELSWEKHKDDPLDVFMKFQEIMQDWPQSFVPIIADMDATKTTWADKKGIENFEELQDYFSD